MLTNIAPVIPEAVLSYLEISILDADENTLRDNTYLVRLLRSLAYEPALFERAVALLVRFASLPSDNESQDESRNTLASLFHIVFSGTHAPINMRVRVAEGLLTSTDEVTRALGVKTLQALMKASHFTTTHEFAFGARSRNYGYFPRQNEVRTWFKEVLKLASRVSLSQVPAKEDVRRVVAAEFRSLFRDSGCAEELDALVRSIASETFWPDGWIATRQTLRYDGKGLEPSLRARLEALDEILRPKDIESKVRGLVIGGRRAGTDAIDDDEDETDSVADLTARAARLTATVKGLGQQVAHNDTVLEALLPELVVSDNPNVVTFGEALAETTDDLRAKWSSIVARFAATKNSLGLVIGYLTGMQRRDADLADIVLDEALEGEPLGPWFPRLQAGLTIDARALARLHRALALGDSEVTTFYSFVYGRVCAAIPGPDFLDLIAAIAHAPGGTQVALRIVAMRLHLDRSDKKELDRCVLEAGRTVLAKFEFGRGDAHQTEDYDLGGVAKACLASPNGASAVEGLCGKLVAASARRDIVIQNYDGLTRALLKIHPTSVLDALFPADAKRRRDGENLIHNLRLTRQPVLDAVPDATLIAWCDQDPATRYPLAASMVTLFKRPEEGKLEEWTPVFAKLLENAPDSSLVFDAMVKRLYPGGWSGSLATKLEGRLNLLNSLQVEDPTLATALVKAKLELQASVEAERRRELEEDRAENTRFE